MKKTRFLVLVLVVSIMLIGAGYAYWNETLKINTYFKAGNLDVNFKWYDISVADDGYGSGNKDNDISIIKAEHVKDTLEFTIEKFK